MKRFLARIQAIFVTGILVTVPVVVTFLALRILFRSLNDLLAPWMERLVGHDVPGLGLAATLLLILLVGLVASNFVGRRIIFVGEALFARLPLVRVIYRTAKEIVGAVTLPSRQLLHEVVLIEYPRPGLFAYGFVMSYMTRPVSEGTQELANVYLPSPPIPTSGALVAVPVEDLQYLQMTSEEAMKLMVSGGLVAPDQLLTRGVRDHD